MSQTESAPDTTPESPDTAAAKTSRHPIERIVVWSVIAIGVVVVGIEARAKFGYDRTYSSISKKLVEVDESDDPNADLSLNDALKLVQFGPSMSEIIEIEPERAGELGEWHKKLSWFSLAKTYELTLVFSVDEDSGNQTMLRIETPNPPAEPEPTVTPAQGGGGEGPGGGGGMGGIPGGEMAGGPGGGGPGGGGRGGRGRAPGLAGLLSVEEVAAELKLDEEQQTKIDALSETLQADMSGMREIFGQLREADESERAQLREQLTTMQREIDVKAKEALKEILNEEQMTRLQQIVWQQARQSPLLTEEVAALLKLSEEQQTQLKSLSDELADAIQDVGFSERGAIRESYNEKFLAVLTEEQQAKWKSLLGEPFEMPAPTFGGGRPGGGGNSERPQRPQRPQ